VPLEFVTREKWGAKPPRVETKRDPSTLQGVAVHWFGKPSAAASHDGCPALLRSVQNTHMKPGGLGTKNGAADIGYNHAVCPHGVAYTLRGFGVQTGANGTKTANEQFASVVYMGGEEDGRPVTEEALPVIAEVIRMWQAKGAGPLVRPHGSFVKTGCPGPDLLKWIALVPPPWAAAGGPAPKPAVEDETPDWLMDFLFWRLAQDADPKKRPKEVPDPAPASAFEALSRMERVITVMGPQEQFLDWVEWRRQGADEATRPRTLPERIPDSWFESLERLQRIFKGIFPSKKPSVEDVDDEAEEPAEETTDTRPVTAETKLLAKARATPQALEAHMLGRDHGQYTDDDVRRIIGLYDAACKTAGLDLLLVVTQMIHETGNLTSFWSQRPRRNPAGIGVTGKPGEGVSFPSWEKAVRAHVGRLLAYALPKDSGNPEQRALIAEALEARPLHQNFGAAAKLGGLTGTWAMDKEYDKKLARLANTIRQA
jgi:hypothetical protein